MSNDANVALAESLHAKQNKMKPEQINMRDVVGRDKDLIETDARAPGVMAEQFPTADLTAKSERDRLTEAKLQLAAESGSATGYTPFGKLIAKDEDFQWYQRKAAAAEAANFQAWFAKEFDRMSPAEKKRAKELYPEFYRQRKKLLKQQSKNLFELARLKLEGVQNMDDLKTQYLAETGRLDLGPLQNLLHPENVFSGQSGLDSERARYAQAKFQRGLLSPFRVFGDVGAQTYADDGAERTKLAMRVRNQTNYAQQSNNFSYGLGIRTGFPPMPTESRAQDAEWWQILRNGPQ